jgi:hypothetical protein
MMMHKRRMKNAKMPEKGPSSKVRRSNQKETGLAIKTASSGSRETNYTLKGTPGSTSTSR